MNIRMNKKFIVAAMIPAVLFFISITCFGDGKESVWAQLRTLLMIPGVSGMEHPVADYLMEQIPSKLNPKRDDMHNVWFSIGAGSEHLVFVAHTDELGLIVEEITPEGKLKVSGRGGFIPKMYEGWPVTVYTEDEPVNGIVIPRPNYYGREQDAVHYQTADIVIDIGAVSDEDARQIGIAVGDQITIHKQIIELSEDIIAARAVDDRAGCAVLLAAMERLDWGREWNKKITFLWDVQEETGLYGAAKMAKQLHADYVFPVDTFVSSAGPFDDRRFAYLPLGQGAVIRAVDSSSITPVPYVQKVMDIARENRIAFQIGNTRGGNDGSVFVPYGAVDIPLAWPGLYSHSFIEKIHRSDLNDLTDLVVALVEQW